MTKLSKEYLKFYCSKNRFLSLSIKAVVKDNMSLMKMKSTPFSAEPGDGFGPVWLPISPCIVLTWGIVYIVHEIEKIVFL